MFGFSVGDVNANTLDDEVLSAERLSDLQRGHGSGRGGGAGAGLSVMYGAGAALPYLIIRKCDESESTEWLGDKNIRDFPILHKELPQVICGHVFCATAHKHFPTPQRLIHRLLFYRINTDG